jgi:hypothetical protein
MLADQPPVPHDIAQPESIHLFHNNPAKDSYQKWQLNRAIEQDAL